jgi:hypothetical protein
MTAIFFWGLNLPGQDVWLVPLAGLVTAGLFLAAGRLVYRWRRHPPAPTAPAPAASYDPFERGSTSERRSTVRRQGNPVEVLVSDAEATADPSPGWVTDRSMGGLCLMLPEPRKSGEVLSLRPKSAPPGTPWVRLEVKTCKRGNDGCYLGCEFVRTPPWSVLLMFG